MKETKRNIYEEYKRLIENPKKNPKQANTELFFSKLKNAKDTDYIEQFNYKMNREFYTNKFQVSNLHDGEDSFSILTCLDALEIVEGAIEAKAEKLEQSIGFLYNLYQYTSEILKFLIDYKDNIQTYLVEKKIDSFSLDSGIPEVGPLYYNSESLYNGDGIYELMFLHMGLWDSVKSFLAELDTINVFLSKLCDARSDYEENSTTPEDINSRISKNYNSLFEEYDDIDSDEYKPEFENKDWFYSKDKIAKLAQGYAEKHRHVIDQIHKDSYTFYLKETLKNSGFFYSDLYKKYRCIAYGYEVELQHLRKNK